MQSDTAVPGWYARGVLWHSFYMPVTVWAMSEAAGATASGG